MQQMTNMLANGGGMKDQAGQVEPTSGNVVPPGALKEEVKDGIDAKLSEGEFVFSADVVRFFGLQKLMSMRDQAKIGLQKMNDIGQMGNADEVANPEALQSEPTSTKAAAPDFGSEVDAALADAGNTQKAFAVGGMADQSAAKTDTYMNESGQKIYVPLVNGNPVIDIPMGFTKQETPAVAEPVQMAQDVQQPVQDVVKPAFAGGGLAPYGLRHSGDAPKGKGYFGEIKHTSGDVSTELSSEFEYKGKNIEHPLLVPTLTKGEIDHLVSGKEPTNEIYDKAELWAKSRVDSGKSPFIEHNEPRHPIPEEDKKYARGGLARKRKK
jgi:hypothetical protein